MLGHHHHHHHHRHHRESHEQWRWHNLPNPTYHGPNTPFLLTNLLSHVCLSTHSHRTRYADAARLKLKLKQLPTADALEEYPGIFRDNLGTLEPGKYEELKGDLNGAVKTQVLLLRIIET